MPAEVAGPPAPRRAVTAYGISKAALNALAAELAPVLVNAVCPGLTVTFPGAEAMGARPVEESAAGVVSAATLPTTGPRAAASAMVACTRGSGV